ncbi:ribonuclease P protein component [Hymenobacter gelipurpurascens]|uniref:Ribonuclease P protein component n=1 Tax=Hymenobacter gelipurpurascens TaxID=89968 RepID=A0A212UGY1_9BACT|nr:ribonuclease P protein component [Hymenobacter gelipurpurascens]SNC77519.1 ribonuclease P protein component [Hymenobacter gelipurpurascens]
MHNTPGARSYSFPKEEHLCRKKLIEELFGRGSSFGLYPLRIVWLPTPEPTTEPPQVLVSVSKRNFKRAIDRNYFKRLMREAYRLNKYRLLEAEGGHTVGQLAIIYTGKEKKPFTLVEKKLISGLERLLDGASRKAGVVSVS